jgi:hypothetical protein
MSDTEPITTGPAESQPEPQGDLQGNPAATPEAPPQEQIQNQPEAIGQEASQRGAGQEVEKQKEKAVDLGSLLDLGFGPSWARQSPSANFKTNTRTRPDRPERSDRDRDRRSSGPRNKPYQPGERKPFTRPRPFEREERYEEPAPLLPVHVSLLPQQKVLWTIIREITVARKAFPVGEVAGLFVNKEDACEVKVEVRHEAPDLFLYQCKICRTIATDRGLIARHIQTVHVEDHFERLETLAEPPAGQFNCVARCGLTGTILGPPNHHSYAESLRELHAARFPEMPFENFTQSIQTVRDPALIEQWKEESRKQIVYQLKNADPEKTPPMRRAAAESWLMEHVVPSAILRTRRAIMPKHLSWEMKDPGLARAVRDAWNREKRYPASMLFALRGAFRHRNLCTFRSPDGIVYVTSVQPTPLAADNVVDAIRELLKYIEGHPRCSRADLLKDLRPGTAADSPEAAQLLQPVNWLADKGHIVEFSNGTFSLPLPVEPPAPEEKVEAPVELLAEEPPPAEAPGAAGSEASQGTAKATAP